MSLILTLTLNNLINQNILMGACRSCGQYNCYEIEADAPQFNYHGPKIKIPIQESHVFICTADMIGHIRSQRLF
jgi:hypothetical protein